VLIISNFSEESYLFCLITVQCALSRSDFISNKCYYNKTKRQGSSANNSTITYITTSSYLRIPRDRLSSLTFLVVSLSPSRQIPDRTLKLAHDRFLPHPFQFTIHPSSSHSSPYSLSYWATVVKETVNKYKHIFPWSHSRTNLRQQSLIRNFPELTYDGEGTAKRSVKSKSDSVENGRVLFFFFLFLSL
jgi:hypothetical protein